jgi:hypothetical protein
MEDDRFVMEMKRWNQKAEGEAQGAERNII